MQQVSPVLTRQTTHVAGRMGFNTSHSMGTPLLGLIYGYLPPAHNDLSPGFFWSSAFVMTAASEIVTLFTI